MVGVTPFRWTGPGLWPGRRPSSSLHTRSGIHSSTMNDDGEGYTTFDELKHRLLGFLTSPQSYRSMSSHSKVAKNDSHIALS